MTEQFKLGDIRGEVKTLSCLKNFKSGISFAATVNSSPSKLPDVGHLGHFGISVKNDNDPTKRQHVFKNVWERNIGPQTQYGGVDPTAEKSYEINWKQWPPPIPEILPAIKIPVEFVPQVDYKLSQSGLWREVSSGTQAQPMDPDTTDFFKTMHGSLNMPQSECFTISPPSLLFINSKLGEYYTATLKLKNNGYFPRRIRVVPPFSRSFHILWGSDLNEKTMLSPGLTTRIVVQFRPTNNKAVNDILMVVIDGDGAVIVPMMSASATPPTLETTEWDCGCSTIGNERVKSFEIKNVGGDARFWILSEEEFRKEYLAVFREFEKKRGRKQSEARPKDYCHPKMNKLKFKLDQVYTRCFRLYPSCFRLQRNQKIEIKARYTPKDANFHYEKLALLCDNGEVRWIAMRGMGLDTKSPKILELAGNWSAPPCDLPSDINANYIIDCGDLIPGETVKPTFTVTNKSCLPLYFFWCLRPIQSIDGVLLNPISKNMLQRHIEGSLQVEWEDYDMKMNNSRPSTPSNPIRIFPAQGIIEGNQEITCTVTVDCPHGFGYHSGILSIFVEQVSDMAKSIILPQIQELELGQFNDIPIYYDDLIQTMPEIPNLKKHQEDLYKHFHPKSHPFNPDANAVKVDETKVNDNTAGNVKHSQKRHKHHDHKSKHKRKSTDNDFFDEESPSVPLFTLKRMNTRDGATFQLSQLHIPNSTTGAEDLKAKPSVELIEQAPEEEEDASAAKPVEVPKETPKITPLNLYQQFIQRQRDADAAKNQIPETKEENEGEAKAHSETKSVKIIEGKEEGSEEIKPTNASVDSIFKEDESVAVGGITKRMSDYLRRSIIQGPKTWLKDTSALMPVKEVEIWIRSIPLQSWFYPPFIIAAGTSGWVIERTVQFHNQSKHPVEVEWDRFNDEVCSVSTEPQVMLVKSLERSSFRVKIQFQKFGKVHTKLNGIMTLPFSVFPCHVSLEITTTSPSLEILTPLLSFGLVTYGAEKVKSLAIKNTGIKKAKWRAKVADEPLENEDSQIIAKHQTQIVSAQLVRVWPEWGILDPGEVAGAQVYFSAEVHGRVATSIEIVIDENPYLTTYVTVCADVQSPCLFFENGFFPIPMNVFHGQPSYDSNIKINNPTGFFLAFSWQCPIGRQSKFCTVEIEPKIGFVAPKAQTECRVTVTNPDNLSLYNLFVPCCVEGMKEPLVMKIFTSNS